MAKVIPEKTDVTIIGAGIVGIATAYYLKKLAPDLGVILLDAGPPMAFTTAQSGDNYRNWWPHRVMKTFTDRSITLMEEISHASKNVINMSRRGYVLATRFADTTILEKELHAGYGDDPDNKIRIHDAVKANSYDPPLNEDWTVAPSGVDILRNDGLIKKTFPWYDPDIRTIVHIRRAGTISGQQMGQYMLDQFCEQGGTRILAEVMGIDKKRDFLLRLGNDERTIESNKLINASGPFLNRVSEMLGVSLPVKNILQQKIAFEDTEGVIARRMPFSIDLDRQRIDWTEEERQLLLSDPTLARFAKEMPGAIHCRPEGGDHGTWLKLGWAYNEDASTATLEPKLDDNFVEIVLRGATRLNPGLKKYWGRLPRSRIHYGGYYTMTEENWPLIGPLSIKGAYVVGAMSGFGTMAACGSGELCAKWVIGEDLPDYAPRLAPDRHSDTTFLADLLMLDTRGLL